MVFMNIRVITNKTTTEYQQLSNSIRCNICSRTLANKDVIHKCYTQKKLIIPLCTCACYGPGPFDKTKLCHQCYLILHVPYEEWDVKTTTW